jgi:SAM-dependent methyltransferase
MLETANTRIDIGKLERDVSWDSRKYGFLWSGVDALDPAGGAPQQAADNGLPETSLAQYIDAASAVSNIESPDYSMQRYPPPLRWVARFTAKCVLYFGRIVTHTQTHFNYHVVGGLARINKNIERIDQASQMHAGILGWTSSVVPELSDCLKELGEQHGTRLTQADSERAELRDGVSNLGNDLGALRANFSELECSATASNSQLETVLRGMEEKIAHLSSRLSLQERKIASTASQGSTEKATAEKRDLEAVEPSVPGGALDGFYMVFEDHFRGSREDILGRLEAYLPLVKECLSGVEKDGLVLDIGCGRGEWLELLSSQGVKALGIDNNAGFLVQCEQLDLEGVESDALQYLTSLPDASVSILSGFHIIEHLQFDVLMLLVDEVHRVLQPGGMVIFETPNPKNLIVGACNFYADPTHVRQIFPDLIEFVLQSRGYVGVELKYLNPHPPAQQLNSEEAPLLAAQLNGMLSCARDFAVIGYK